jgi:ssRNA-specific RNase YbeY (16S rRNA maturation enzyme)
LHILGYDHEDEEDEKVMFALQETIVSEWEEMQ